MEDMEDLGVDELVIINGSQKIKIKFEWADQTCIG